MYASCSTRIDTYGLVSVPAKDHRKGAWGGTETAVHWRKGLQDGMLRAIEDAYVHLLAADSSTNTSFMDTYPKLVRTPFPNPQIVI